jgi:hypothetical protein
MSGPWASDLRRLENEVKQGLVYTAGQLALVTSGTTTSVTRDGVSSSSIVSLTPYDTGAKNEGIPQVVPTNGAFTITHTSTSTPRTYRFVVHTPQ